MFTNMKKRAGVLALCAMTAVPVVNIASEAASGAWHPTPDGSQNCDASTGTRTGTFKLQNTPESWNSTKFKMFVKSDELDAFTPGASAEVGAWITSNSITLAGNAGDVVRDTAVVYWSDGKVTKEEQSIPLSITLEGDCQAPIPTTVTGSVNQTACDTSSDFETYTVTFEIKGAADASADLTYSWTAEGLPLSTSEAPLGEGHYGLGIHAVDVQTPIWATPGMPVSLDVDYTANDSRTFAALLTHHIVKGSCLSTPPPVENPGQPPAPAPTPVNNNPKAPVPAPAPHVCTEAEVQAGTCLATTGASDGTMNIAMVGIIAFLTGIALLILGACLHNRRQKAMMA